MARPARPNPELPGKKETITWHCVGCPAKRAAYVGQRPREWSGQPGDALCGKCSWKKQKQILAERGELVLMEGAKP